MKRGFIVLIEGGTAQLRNTITERLAKSPMAYWHWMADVWLVSGAEVGVTAKSLAEWLELTPGFGSLSYLVFSSENALDWYGRNTPAAWEWMSSEWK